MQKKILKIIFAVAIAFLLLSSVFLGTHKSISTNPNPISITVLESDNVLHLSPRSGMSLYETLVSAQKNGQLEFSGKNYPALGFFITDVGTLHSGQGKNLIYYINNKEASVGVSSYIPQDGDVILWKLE
jgi:hypothetical protein